MSIINPQLKFYIEGLIILHVNYMTAMREDQWVLIEQ